ncbi:hypothetical protein HK096_000861, partial [Nowakowskiella sp. JEL0078]
CCISSCSWIILSGIWSIAWNCRICIWHCTSYCWCHSSPVCSGYYQAILLKSNKVEIKFNSINFIEIYVLVIQKEMTLQHGIILKNRFQLSRV